MARVAQEIAKYTAAHLKWFFFLKCNLNVNLNFENFLCLLIVNQKSIGCCDEQEKNAFFDQHRSVNLFVPGFSQCLNRLISTTNSSFFLILKKSHRDAYTKLISRNVFNGVFLHAKNLGLGINIATSFWKKENCNVVLFFGRVFPFYRNLLVKELWFNR